MLLPVARFGSLTNIQRIRKLKQPGEVLVYESQQVLPGDVIAETVVPSGITMVEIAHSLEVETPAIKEYLVREPGENFMAGDTIAQITGTFSRLVRAPIDGCFQGLSQGKAVLSTGQNKIQVKAGMMGVVQSVIPDYGAVITTSGFLLQGLWGNGATSLGELQIITDSWAQPLTPEMLDERGEGKVLVAGFCVDADALNWFGKRSSGGLILDIMAPQLIELAAALPIPIIVLRGFGVDSPDPTLLDWLTPHVDKSVSLNASPYDRLTGMLPEAIIQANGDERLGLDSVKQTLKVGQKVRVFSGNIWGAIAEVLSLPEGEHVFESGVVQPAAVVQIGQGDTRTVPQQNLIIVDGNEVS
jgi:hypothetical protein